ncbi:2-oxoacid:ferredoxin oxidoreductase subunit beta [Bacteriovoracaceae bacterium]|nr:2-oxoacid:ferredoxin oxidoreductase subunit beta [Bacteriovoracaceae bacterium]
MSEQPTYKKKDFVSDQEVRWCPGCGDYAILSSVQLALTKLGRKKEEFVFVSGIGCSSRFPYYMNTYGLHTIHGRAPALASGIKTQNPDLSVWIITGDGDGLSIGGNHLIHVVRRNLDVNILLFNNEIYGLTKGQYSPTSNQGLVTKSTPQGSIDRPFQPAPLLLGARSSFYARTLDTDPKHMQQMFTRSYNHKGTSFVEIFQNCVIFNDKIHEQFTNRASRDDTTIRVEHGQPMIFGKEKNKGIILKDVKPEVVTIGENGVTEADLLVHDETNPFIANLLAHANDFGLPVPYGVLYCAKDEACYEEGVHSQINAVIDKKGKGDMKKLLFSGETITVD